MVNSVIIFVASCSAAYLARPNARRCRPRSADLLVGLIGGGVGMSVAHVLSGGAPSGLGLPLLLGCALAIGLQSRQAA
jgi:hypothetical protein